MHWIVQEDLHAEEGYTALLTGLERLSIPHTIVKVIPFSDGLPYDQQTIPSVDPKGRIMVAGSTTLSKIARQRGWSPGSFLNDEHDTRVCGLHYGDLMLNTDMTVCRFADVAPQPVPFFIRPCADNKTFSGRVMDWPEFEVWRDGVIKLRRTYTTLDGDTMVTHSSCKTIYREIRFFIVDRVIAAKSTYKIGSRVVYDRVVDDDAVHFVSRVIDGWRGSREWDAWQPARAYVIDIALTADGYRIIEVNCINAAGYYDADVLSLVACLDSMPE